MAKLPGIIKNHYKLLVASGCENAIPPLFLKEEQTHYEDDEMEAFFQRDFITRLYIVRTSINLESVFLRTKFTDNHPKTSYLNSTRDYIKATHVTKNYTSAKANCAELLSMCLQAFSDHSSTSKYYSFATTMASGLSDMAQNTEFEQGMVTSVTDLEEVNLARRQLCLLMHIIFSKIATYRFLVNEQGSNCYRISYCMLKISKKNRMPVMFSIFSLCLQGCLTGYVVAANVGAGVDSYLARNVPLAIVTLLYGAILAYPSLMDREKTKSFYARYDEKWRWNFSSFFLRLLPLMDFFVNQILAKLLVVSGVLVILSQESFIEAVLNTAALLFIADIDDSLPSLLGLDEKEIIENYLIRQSLQEFDALFLSEKKNCSMCSCNARFSTQKLQSIHGAIGVNFQDYYLTNIEEGPSQPDCGKMFQPYQIRAPTILRCDSSCSEEGASSLAAAVTGSCITPSNFVTEHCLIRELTWAYSHSEKYANTTKPRIAWLKIVKMRPDRDVGIGCGGGGGIGMGDVVDHSKPSSVTDEESTAVMDDANVEGNNKINPNEIIITSRKLGEIDDEGISISKVPHTLRGVFVITSFQMSNDILRLRVCGSSNARDFLRAMEYYSLWDVTSGARYLLEKEAKEEALRAKLSKSTSSIGKQKKKRKKKKDQQQQQGQLNELEKGSRQTSKKIKSRVGSSSKNKVWGKNIEQQSDRVTADYVQMSCDVPGSGDVGTTFMRSEI